jgi:hypothetical protein
MSQKPSLDDIWIYIFKHGPVRMRDLQQVFVATKKLSRPTLYRYRKQLVDQGKIQVQSVAGNPPFNIYSVPFQHHPIVQVFQQFNYSPDNLGLDLDDIPWKGLTPELNGRRKFIHMDPTTGAELILINAPKGVHGRAHVHLQANQWSFGLYGEAIRQDGTIWQFKNSIGYYPKGMPHGDGIITKESLCLTFYDGPKTATLIDNDYTLASKLA